MTKVNQSRIREALTAGTNVKEKGPPAADGILSVTPDTPEMLEWRSRSALDEAETSSTFLDDEEDGGAAGPKPHELYGKFTWKIENFSEISKRELRSSVFDVGNYKWYILVYPQGCDVCNHLSLFLCVADYDKLLPGWSHFAQFTIAVVNKDPKKSKYSDTLHRFCKKEHDWGWKKFMELSKVLDGFTVADTLVIKAQVQVILDKPSKPFRCLDPQYRRELVRVYLTNVEGICRRFCEDKKARLAWAREEAHSFRHFWASLTPEQQRKLLTDKGETILKAVVKQFFNEKEVTSTLVMDALYSGCKQIEEHSRTWLEGKSSDNAPVVLIKAERSSFTLCGDLLDIADRVQKDFIPAAKDDSKQQALQANDGLTLRSGQDGDDYRRDSIERDEKRLAELGRKTVEMFVISHIFCEKLEIAYREAEALKRQDQLIAEEFEMARLEESKAQAKAQADKEKKAKKKEKLKQKKEAEKQKREAEEAERKAREDELRRQEAERRAKEAEKKRLEDAQVQPQPHVQAQPQPGRKAAKTRDDRRAQQQLQQATAKAKAAPAAAPYAGTAEHAHGSALPGPSDSAAAGAGTSSGAAAAAAALLFAGQPERPAPRGGDWSSDSGEEEVGTVDQATGAVESSADPDDDGDAAGGSVAGGPGTESDESEGRAALEEEVIILRAQVVQLTKQLAEREAELYALRAQLAELHPAEIADLVRDGGGAAATAAAAPGGAAAAPAPSGPAGAGARAANGAAAAEGAAAAAPAGREGATDAGGPPAPAPGGRPEAQQQQHHERPARGGAEPSLANGPKEAHRSDGGPLSIPAAAAAAAAAAARRMQPAALAAGGASALSPEAAAAGGMLHHGVPARPPGTGSSVAPGGQVAASGRGGAGAGLSTGAQARAGGLHAGGVAVEHSAAPGGPGPDSHLGGGAALMQRSTSATLPGVGAANSASGTGAAAPYAPLAQHALAAAANGRPRAQGLDGPAGASGSAAGGGGGGAKPGAYLPPSGGGVGGPANGILHAPAGGVQDSLPSYRNAAAGVLTGAQPVSAAAASAAAAAAAAAAAHPPSAAASGIVPVAVSAQAGMLPVSPTAAAAQGAASGKRLEEGPAAAPRHLAHGVAPAAASAAAAAEFSATSARIMMQQAQRTGLGFGTPAAVASAAAKQRMAAPTQMDSPGLEDFAHINMIDDLLTE